MVASNLGNYREITNLAFPEIRENIAIARIFFMVFYFDFPILLAIESFTNQYD